MSLVTLHFYIKARSIKSAMQQAAMNHAFREYQTLLDPVGQRRFMALVSSMPQLPEEGHLLTDQYYNFLHAVRFWYSVNQVAIPADTQVEFNQVLR
jgi:hypothetical protein